MFAFQLKDRIILAPTTRRQVSDLTAVGQRQGYQVIQIIQEIGSATKRNNVDRPEVDQLLKLCRSKTIRKVLVTEFSPLGRRRSETPVLMEAITEAGVSVYAHNLGLETLMANGKRNSVADIVEIDAMETERLSAGWPVPTHSLRFGTGPPERQTLGTTVGLEDEYGATSFRIPWCSERFEKRTEYPANSSNPCRLA